MAEKIPDSVPRATLTLGGKERSLVFTLGTAIRLKRAMGMDLGEAFARFKDGDIEHVPALLWAMVAHGDDADLTADEVADMIPIDSLGRINEAIGELVKASNPEPKGAPGEAKARRTKKAGK